MSLFEYRSILSRSWQAAERRVYGDRDQQAKESTLRAELLKVSERPIAFARRYLGERTTPISRGIQRALFKHHYVAIWGCRKSTKSHSEAQEVVHMTCTAPTRTIVTSASYTQMRENIFARARQIHAAATIPLPGRCGVTSIRFDDPTHYAIGISVAKPGNIQGIHSDVTIPPYYEYDDVLIDEDSLLRPDPAAVEADLRREERDGMEVLLEEIWNTKKAIERAPKTRAFWIFDETAEMKPEIIQSAQGSWMGDNVYVLFGFNPTFPPESDHPAANTLKPESPFYTIHIAGREPLEGMHDGIEFDECHHGVPPEIMPEKWIAERHAEWGKTSALTTCHVYGLPAASFSEWQFIPHRLLVENDIEDSTDDLDSYHIGVDIGASDEGDPSVAKLWIGGNLAAMHEWRSHNLMTSAAVVLDLMAAWGLDGRKVPARNVHVDNTGVGKGVVDRLRQMGEWVDAVDFAESPRQICPRLNGSYEFVNLKAELFWTFRRLLEERELYVPPRFKRCREQAGWYSYKHHARENRTLIGVRETKPEIKKKFRRSPDHFEAAAIGLARNGAGRSEILFLD